MVFQIYLVDYCTTFYSSGDDHICYITLLESEVDVILPDPMENRDMFPLPIDILFAISFDMAAYRHTSLPADFRRDYGDYSIEVVATEVEDMMEHLAIDTSAGGSVCKLSTYDDDDYLIATDKRGRTIEVTKKRLLWLFTATPLLKCLAKSLQLCPTLSNNNTCVSSCIHTVMWRNYILQFGPQNILGVANTFIHQRYHQCSALLTDIISYPVEHTIGISKQMANFIANEYPAEHKFNIIVFHDNYANLLSEKLIITATPDEWDGDDGIILTPTDWYILCTMFAAAGITNGINYFNLQEIISSQ